MTTKRYTKAQRERLVAVHTHADCLAINEFARLDGADRAAVRQIIYGLARLRQPAKSARGR